MVFVDFFFFDRGMLLWFFFFPWARGTHRGHIVSQETDSNIPVLGGYW